MKRVGFGYPHVGLARKMKDRKQINSVIGIGYLVLTSLFPMNNCFGANQNPVVEVTDELLSSVPDGGWYNFRGNLANWGFSALDDITRENVSLLTLAWSWPLDQGTNETTPVVHNGMLFVANPGGAIQALDADDGNLLWEYIRPFPKGFVKTLGAHTRSLALYKNRLFSTTGDGYLLALDTSDGSVAWQTKVGEFTQISQTTGPIAAKGKVFSGRSCLQSFEGSCYITAHDAITGKELWRTHVVPAAGEYGDETWGGLPHGKRRHVGAWGPGAFDPELNLVYWGTSVPAPSNEYMRGNPGAKMLYTNSTLALDADTGKIVWYFQHLPRDNWDMDHVFERILVDTKSSPRIADTLAINPDFKADKPRKLMTGIPGKTGLVWTLDRETGKFFWVKETVQQNFVKEVDLRTGEVTLNPEVLPKTATDTLASICPSNKGGKNWPPGAYSPRTNALYMPLQNTCMDLKPLSDDLVPGQVGPEAGYGMVFNIYQRPNSKSLGQLHAVSVESGKTLWRYEERAGMMGVLATGGGLIFVGDTNRRFRALDDKTGEVLWETVLNAPVTGSPITFAVAGKQYVAVTVGGGDWVSGELNSIASLPSSSGHNMLYVFTLPGRIASIERISEAHPLSLSPGVVVPSFTTKQSARGKNLYTSTCIACHGEGMSGTSNAPGLSGAFFMKRWHDRSAFQLFETIKNTMPLGSAGILEREQVLDLLAYWLELNGHMAGETPLSNERQVLQKIPLRTLEPLNTK